jgi:lysophospholipase L1-like esterase
MLKSINKKTVLFVVYIIGLVILGDLCLKYFVPLSKSIRYSVMTKIHGPNAYEIQEPNKRPRVAAKSYFLYANTPGFTDKFGLQHDDNGYRENSDTINPEAALKVLVLGGSTTYGVGIQKPDEVWTHEMQELYNASGVTADVINGGLNYALSSELLAKYAFKDQWIDHDLLIIHAGGNEYLPIAFPDFKPDYSHVRMQAGQTTGVIEKSLLQKSGIIRLLWGSWASGSGFGMTIGQPFAFGKLKLEDAMQRINIPERYTPLLRNLGTIIDIAKNAGRKVLIVPFVSNHYNPSYNMESISHLVPSIPIYLKKMRTALKLLAKEKNVGFFELEEGVISESSFVDNCHLNSQGQKEKASAVFKHLTLSR